MLYVTRSRYKELVMAAQLEEINQIIDTEIIPAIKQVEGVRACQAYNSITGELTFVVDIQDMATVDRILLHLGVKAALGKIYDKIIRTGGEVLFDRPQWQKLYGRS